MKQSKKMSELQLDARAPADFEALQAYESGDEASEEEAEGQETVLGADSESPFAVSNGPAKLSRRKRKTVIHDSDDDDFLIAPVGRKRQQIEGPSGDSNDPIPLESEPEDDLADGTSQRSFIVTDT